MGRNTAEKVYAFRSAQRKILNSDFYIISYIKQMNSGFYVPERSNLGLQVDIS